MKAQRTLLEGLSLSCLALLKPRIDSDKNFLAIVKDDMFPQKVQFLEENTLNLAKSPLRHALLPRDTLDLDYRRFTR